MARILAIDYGKKRTGLAVTDPDQLIARPLAAIESARIFTFLAGYFAREPVERIVLGFPSGLDDSDTHVTEDVRRIHLILGEKFPAVPVELVDEQFSSKAAMERMVEMGMKKSQRRQKGNTDMMAATVILTEYLLGR